jgi:hypothetical protein
MKKQTHNQRQKEDLINQVKQRFHLMAAHLSEKDKRLWAASEASIIGRGGDTIVCEATGISRVTIGKGKKELTGKANGGTKERIRKTGGGRKRLIDKNPDLVKDLDMLIEPLARGDSESPLRWTCQSTYSLAEALREKAHNVSQKTVYLMLQEMGYSMQGNRKIKEGEQNPDRDAQFNIIYKQVKEFQVDGQPVISVDAKKRKMMANTKIWVWNPPGNQPR